MRKQKQFKETPSVSTHNQTKRTQQIHIRHDLKTAKFTILLLILIVVCVIFGVVISAENNQADSPLSPSAVFTVNDSADTGDGACTTETNGCTLREAITAANNSAGADTIQFALGASPVINVGSSGLGQLPAITDAVTINGNSGGAVYVELNGAGAGAGAIGIYVTAGGTTINNLIINRFNGNGIRLETGGGNTIKKCYVGTNAGNAAGIGNGTGIFIMNSASNLIGGLSPDNENIISGNIIDGLRIEGANSVFNKVQGNYIGTNRGGTVAVGNGFNGVVIINAGNNIIGAARGFGGIGNLISGNGKNGVGITGNSSANTVGRNVIGLHNNLNAAIGNGENGVYILNGATNNLIGDTSFGNYIAGNAMDGVRIEGATTTGNRVYQNQIGINSLSEVPIGNGFNGILISNAPNNIIGDEPTSTTPLGNEIAGNVKNGISITGASATGNRIQGNQVGVSLNSGALIGNNQHGLYLTGSASGNLIGGTELGELNSILSNGGDGIYADSGTRNQIIGNIFRSNTGLGIDLAPDGVNPNDAGDGDTGANNLQNFPVLTAAQYTPNEVTVLGNFNSTPNTQFTIHFFETSPCDASGHGEGIPVYYNPVQSSIITTDANGNSDINLSVISYENVGRYITATATDPSGNTSEFSNCVIVSSPGTPVMHFSASSYTINEDAGIATVTVMRDGGFTQPVTVNYATSNGTATAGQDYATTSGTLTFNRGELTKTFDIQILDDTFDESNETVNLTLSSPTGGATLGSPSTAVLTIADNDIGGTIRFSTPGYTINENAGSATVTVNRTDGAASGVTVNYATENGTAVAGQDYTATSGTVTFDANETSETFTVPILDDGAVEGSENFTVTLSSPTGGATLGSPSTAIITITDNDTCSYLINPTAQNAPASGGHFTITVTAPNGCLWSAVSTANWLTISSGSSGNGNGMIHYSIAANTGSQRTGRITIAEQNISVTQAAGVFSISGVIYYGTTPRDQEQLFVSGVLMSASGTNSVWGNSGETGKYLLGGLTPGGTYLVEPSKTEDVNGITAFDAALVLRCVAAGNGCSLTPAQLIAADADDDKTVTAFDATQILRFVAANGSNAITGHVGFWHFSPSSRSYDTIGENFTGQDYTAFLIGEIDGDWTPCQIDCGRATRKPKTVKQISEKRSHSGAGTKTETSRGD